MPGRRLARAAVGALLLLGLAVAPAAAEPAGRMAQIEQTDTGLGVVFLGSDLPEGSSIDPDSVRVDLDGIDLMADAALATDQPEPVQQTVMLALDTSGSMSGERLDGAKVAAQAFLDALPAEVAVGLLTFSSTARLVVPTTATRDQVAQAVSELVASGDTALYDATVLAVGSLPVEGVRSILLLTDGTDDGSATTIEQAADAVREAQVGLTAVSFGPQPEQTAALQTLADAGQGSVVATEAVDELAQVFEQAARDIGDQLLIDVAVPAALQGSSGNLTVTAEAGGAEITATAFTSIPAPQPPTAPAAGQPVIVDPGLSLSRPVFLASLAALFVAIVIIVTLALGAATHGQRPEERVLRRLSIYSLTGRQPRKETEHVSRLGTSGIARTAVDLAGIVVEKRDLDALLGGRLQAAGIPLRAPEWLLTHTGVATGAALLLFLASGGSAVATALGLLIGVAGPWLFLSHKQSRRERAFLAAMPETLQLMAGSLQAGYSLPQAVDTVVREGHEPIAGEFNRALIEARLGVQIEDALDGVAVRLHSTDFSWVVMAMRIQRDVGGNLAELLATVADTLRERDRLRRQVQTLSAEGRLSAWILGLLPVAFALYLSVARPEYLTPLVSDALGLIILITGAVLLAVGAFWLSRVVKVEV